MDEILRAVTTWITANVASLGYIGIVIMMGIESACIPLPSEVIMPFGGYLVYKDPARFNIWLMGVAGAIGCVWGSVVAYWVGSYGGRPFIEKYGKYVLIRRKDLDKADAFFARYGDAAIFISRLLPVVRTFISFPAGIARMRFGRFVVYTFLGSFPWCLGLAYLGKILGKQWDTKLRAYFHKADALIIAVILLLVVLYVFHHIKSERE
ncbi:MAG: DedA family protein [Armatimonadota bacterium]|nr:DedA family protein [Armatimonadota bacterium]